MEEINMLRKILSVKKTLEFDLEAVLRTKDSIKIIYEEIKKIMGSK